MVVAVTIRGLGSADTAACISLRVEYTVDIASAHNDSTCEDGRLAVAGGVFGHVRHRVSFWGVVIDHISSESDLSATVISHAKAGINTVGKARLDESLFRLEKDEFTITLAVMGKSVKCVPVKRKQNV